jgi:hypothetical protein
MANYADTSKQFWTSLGEYLCAHYPPPVANKILKSFFTEHQRYVNSLSLDDLERIADKIEKL